MSAFPPIDLDNNPEIEQIRVASQSTRLQILNLLLSPEIKRLYPTHMEKILGVPRRVISFHLSALEEAGLVQSEFGLSEDSRPQAVKYYSATPEGRVTFDRLTHMLKKHH